MRGLASATKMNRRSCRHHVIRRSYRHRHRMVKDCLMEYMCVFPRLTNDVFRRSCHALRCSTERLHKNEWSAHFHDNRRSDHDVRKHYFHSVTRSHDSECLSHHCHSSHALQVHTKCCTSHHNGLSNHSKDDPSHKSHSAMDNTSCYTILPYHGSYHP